MDDCTRKMIQVAVAQTCLNVGWSTIHSSSLEILTDLLSDYILGLCKRTNNYAYLFNQTEPNLDHLGLAFMDLGVSLPELEEYVNYFDNNNCPDVARYPIPKESSLNFLKPGSREVVTRPVHIHEHLPPMYPHLEEQDTAGASKVPGASSPPEVETASAAGAEASASVSPGSGLKRRGDTPAMESFTIRRARALAEEETRQLREISSVMMTTSGFLSHAREGKLPEVRTIIPEPEPEEQPPPPQPPAQPTEPKVEPLPPPPDVKPEKKKKKKSHDPSKKVEKDKVKDDQLPSSSSILTPSILSGLGAKSSNSNLIPDDSQIKKLTTVKETNKLKALKPGATKAIAITPNSFTPTPKSEKKHKPKRPNSPAAAMAGLSPLGVPKSKIPKIDKFQMKERIVVDDAASDTFPDIKLTAEPDKQKLNIFKKISKVKEDHDEIKMEVDSHHLGVKLGKDVTVELVPVETPKKPLIPPSEIKEEKVDVVVDEENFHSPTAIGLVSFVDEIMPGTPTTPKTPDIPKIPSDHKKKKREKHKEKKERDKYVSSPVSSRTIIDDSILSKPKTPEVIVDAPDDHYPPFSFLGYPTGPTIIPPNLASNPLIPQIRVPDAFGPRIPHPPLASLAHPPPQKEVATPTTSASVSTTSSAAVTPSTTTPTESPVTPIKKKEKKDKKNKDKVKKKKDKKEKAKSKEKSEKKKQKLMKKQKLEDKIKLKKEKKDKKKETQNQEEKRGDSPSVPKITFKLGPDPQREQSPNPKITFKPIVKKEEEVGDVPKKHSSDLPQTSTPVTKHHKGSSSKSSKSGAALDLSGHQKLHDAPPPTKAVAPLIVHAPTVPKVEPETSESNQLWICPACGRPDDGSPMIACDACDMWYHYVCVGIQEAPESDWFCQGCISKKPDLTDKKKKHKKKK